MPLSDSGVERVRKPVVFSSTDGPFGLATDQDFCALQLAEEAFDRNLRPKRKHLLPLPVGVENPAFSVGKLLAVL